MSRGWWPYYSGPLPVAKSGNMSPYDDGCRQRLMRVAKWRWVSPWRDIAVIKISPRRWLRHDPKALAVCLVQWTHYYTNSDGVRFSLVSKDKYTNVWRTLYDTTRQSATVADGVRWSPTVESGLIKSGAHCRQLAGLFFLFGYDSRSLTRPPSYLVVSGPRLHDPTWLSIVKITDLQLKQQSQERDTLHTHFFPDYIFLFYIFKTADFPAFGNNPL